MKFFTLMAQLVRANVEAGRRLSPEEFIAHQERKIELLQRAMFHRTIGGLSVAWAMVEILLDYSNVFIINTLHTKETQLPISLKPKLAFYKKHFQNSPELAPFRDRALAIIDDANKLKETRHDIIHGLAIKKAPEGIKRMVRLDYVGKRLVEMPKDYTLDQIMDKTEEIAELATRLTAVLSEAIKLKLGKD